MASMTTTCEDCGGEVALERVQLTIPMGPGRLIADELPALHCQSCGRADPARHTRPQLQAVIDVAQELFEEGVSGPTVRKDFTSTPLEPEDTGDKAD